MTQGAAYIGQLHFKLDKILHVFLGPILLGTQEQRDVYKNLVVGLDDGVVESKQVVLSIGQHQFTLVELKIKQI